MRQMNPKKITLYAFLHQQSRSHQSDARAMCGDVVLVCWRRLWNGGVSTSPLSDGAQPAVLEIRTRNAPIVARVFLKSGARIFSQWRENFFAPAPKPKSSRATFSGRTKEKISARKLIRQGTMLPTHSFSRRNVCRLSLLVEFLPVE